MVGARQAAFHHGEVALKGVGVDVASDVFLDAVTDDTVVGELPADTRVLSSFISHDPAVFRYLLAQNRCQGGRVNYLGGAGADAWLVAEVQLVQRDLRSAQLAPVTSMVLPASSTVAARRAGTGPAASPIRFPPRSLPASPWRRRW